MGFEQLAELRDRLRAEKGQVKADSAKTPKRKSPPQAKPREMVSTEPKHGADPAAQKHQQIFIHRSPKRPRYLRPNNFSISPCPSFTQVGRP